MRLTIKKTIEETLEVKDLPKFFKTSYSHIKLTEENIIGVSDYLIYVTPKDSNHFAKDVTDCLKLNECSEEEFNNRLLSTINKIKILQ